MSIFDSVMSDTVGVVYRATTGSVDPWTKQELVDQQTAAVVQASTDPTTGVASITPEDAAAQAQQDITDTLTTFTLGGDDPVGADPSQAHISLPSGQALKDAGSSILNDNGSGCGITNLGGCVQIPSWAKWALLGGVALVAVTYVVVIGSKAKEIVS
jgi:hypothetical protein